MCLRVSQDKQGLEQQQLSGKLQIAALQSKLDEGQRYHDNTPDPTQPLRDALDTAQLSLRGREQEVRGVTLCSFAYGASCCWQYACATTGL